MPMSVSSGTDIDATTEEIRKKEYHRASQDLVGRVLAVDSHSASPSSVCDVALDSRCTSRDPSTSPPLDGYSGVRNGGASAGSFHSNGSSDFAIHCIAGDIVGSLVPPDSVSPSTYEVQKSSEDGSRSPPASKAEDKVGSIVNTEGKLANSFVEPGRTVPEPCAEAPPKSERNSPLQATMAEPEPQPLVTTLWEPGREPSLSPEGARRMSKGESSLSPEGTRRMSKDRLGIEPPPINREPRDLSSITPGDIRSAHEQIQPTQPTQTKPTDRASKELRRSITRVVQPEDVRVTHQEIIGKSERTSALVSTYDLWQEIDANIHGLQYPDVIKNPVLPCGVTFFSAPNLHDAKLARNAAHGFTVEPRLPEGLSLNGDTGMISGTPRQNCELQSYEVRAFLGPSSRWMEKDLEEVACTLRFSTLSPPINLKYPRASRILDARHPPPIAEESDGVLPAVRSARRPGPASARSLRKWTPRLSEPPNVKCKPRFKVQPTVEGGTVASFKVSPALPPGVYLDKKTGEIRITVEELEGHHVKSTFSVSAINAVGMVTCGVHLDVAHGSWDLVQVEFSSTDVYLTDESDKLENAKPRSTRSSQVWHPAHGQVLEPSRIGAAHGQVWGAEIDWIATAHKAVGILDRFGQTLPNLESTEEGSTCKSMVASSLLKGLGLEETKGVLKNLLHAIGIANAAKAPPESETPPVKGCEEAEEARWRPRRGLRGTNLVTLIEVGPDHEPMVCLHTNCFPGIYKKGSPHRIAKLAIPSAGQTSKDAPFLPLIPTNWRSKYC